MVGDKSGEEKAAEKSDRAQRWAATLPERRPAACCEAWREPRGVHSAILRGALMQQQRYATTVTCLRFPLTQTFMLQADQTAETGPQKADVCKVAVALLSWFNSGAWGQGIAFTPGQMHARECS